MATEKSLFLLRYLPRLQENNLVRNPYRKKEKFLRGSVVKKGAALRKGVMPRRGIQTPLGFESSKTPFIKRYPQEFYYKDVLHRRQYPPFSLYQLQLSIDIGLLRIDEPIDAASICRTQVFRLDPSDNHYGVHLTDNGIDCFKAKLNIEVQHASEQVIAAIERNGGVITTAYYDIASIHALSNPKLFFEKGIPIPKRLLPPPDKIEFYSSAKNRGYLADPAEIAKERFILSQKYGYKLPDISQDPLFSMLSVRKDPRQVFYGLHPGWVVNLRDKEILKPKDEKLEQYYSS